MRALGRPENRDWLAVCLVFLSFWIGYAPSSLAREAGDGALFRDIQIVAASGGQADSVTFAGLDERSLSTEGMPVTFNLDRPVVGIVTRVATSADGTRVWAGTFEGSPAQRFLLTRSDGFLFGRLNTREGEWFVYPAAGGRHFLYRVPSNARTMDWGDDGVLPEIPDQQIDTSLPGQAAALDQISDGETMVDVAIFYSQSMVDLWGAATGARVRYLVALLDQALIDSNTELRVRLVHLGFVNASEVQSNPNTLQDLQRGAGDGLPGVFGQNFSALRAIRDAKGADIVTIIRVFDQNPHTTCGNAYINGGAPDVISVANAPRGISVVSDWINRSDTNLANGYNSCADTTFAHEIGHNLGFAHNLEITSAGTGVRPFAHGHRVDGVFRTIMSGSSGIAGEQRVGLFSNPDNTLCPGGAACGSSNASDPADNARAAREESFNVALFRDEVPRIVSSVLPITRSVSVGSPATAFATIINPASSGSTATACRIVVDGLTGVQFSYQATDSLNAPSGPANTPADIPAGSAQSFVFSIDVPSIWQDDVRSSVASGFDERELFIQAQCNNRRSADFVSGLNTLTLTVSAQPVPDIVALAATLANDGRVNVPLAGNQVGVFSVAVSNVGADGPITISADTGNRALAVDNIEICRTDPVLGGCMTSRSATLQLDLTAGSTATFGIFVRGTGLDIANEPALNRVFVRFASGGTQSGATSVAVRTQ